jgi:hypothetical protein
LAIRHLAKQGQDQDADEHQAVPGFELRKQRFGDMLH